MDDSYPPGAMRMVDQATIRQIAERNIQLLALKPTRGLLACSTRARLAGGLRCEIEEGPWRQAADMPGKAGGDESAPTPGVLGRGALAGCPANTVWATNDLKCCPIALATGQTEEELALCCEALEGCPTESIGEDFGL